MDILLFPNADTNVVVGLFECFSTMRYRLEMLRRHVQIAKVDERPRPGYLTPDFLFMFTISGRREVVAVAHKI